MLEGIEGDKEGAVGLTRESGGGKEGAGTGRVKDSCFKGRVSVSKRAQEQYLGEVSIVRSQKEGKPMKY